MTIRGVIVLLIIGVIRVIVKIVEFFSDEAEKIRCNRQRNSDAEKRREELSQKYNINQSKDKKPLHEKIEEIIKNHLKKLDGGHSTSYYYLDNAVKDCLEDIVLIRGHLNLSHRYRYLSDWRSNADSEYKDLISELSTRFKKEYDHLVELKKEREEKKVRDNFEKLKKDYADFINQFLEITERKVGILDDYGEENWEELPKQIKILLHKIGKKEGYTDEDFKNWDKWSHRFPEPFALLKEFLEKKFKEHYKIQKNKPVKKTSYNDMSGIDFEVHISKLFKEKGYEVAGTPKTGDQGADLIAKKHGEIIIIQAKRYSGNVGNKAVQEVVSAKHFYNGDHAWVITNSLFTPSAKALAQKNGVRLIDGLDLKRIQEII